MHETTVAENVVCPLTGEAAELYTQKSGYNIYRCKGSRIIFIHPLPTTEQTESVYGQEYFCGADHGFGYTDYDADKEPMRGCFTKYLRYIERYQVPGNGKSILDVGASTGFFLSIAQGMGWEASGVEVAPYASQTARDRGFAVQTGTLEESDFPVESFDVVTGWDVFEHMLDPAGFLDKAHELLKPGGLIALNTPTCDSVWARVWRRKWNAILPPEHIYLFGKRSLQHLLEQHGFTVVHTGKVGKKFSIPYIFQTVHRWTGVALFDAIARATSKTWLKHIWLPLDVRDNIFMIAQKECA